MTFSQRTHANDQQVHEKMLNSTRHQGNANKTMKYHCTPIRMSTIKKARNNKCWRGHGRKGALLHSWWECPFAQPLGNSIEVPQEVKHRTTSDYLTSPLLATEFKENETLSQGDSCTSCSLQHFFRPAKVQKQPEWLWMHEQIKKMVRISTVENYSALKKKGPCQLWQHGWTQRTSC